MQPPGTAVVREAAWLKEAVPPLGFDSIDAHHRRTSGNKRTLKVSRLRTVDQRIATGRTRATHTLVLLAVWPTTARDGASDQDQDAFDAALDRLIGHLRGPLGDKTHGGRFLSACEEPNDSITVDLTDPDLQQRDGKALTARITFTVDDFDIIA